MEPDYDIIIIGAGSAGCVLANRLSAQRDLRVLLLEAGGEARNPWLHIPIGYAKLFADQRYNWFYKTEPESELNNRAASVARGKVLGGSSMTNGMIFVRGQREDYDLWRQLGNTGWDYDSVLPYFRRSEDWVGGDDEFRGAGGPLAVSLPDPNPLCQAFFAAAEQEGLPYNPDYNGDHQHGAAYMQMTVRNGRRAGTATAFLRPARKRPNLHVITGALAERVVFDGNRAVGVEYVHRGARVRVASRGEVILAAGAIASPQLLQRSGVGPGALLQEHGIPVVVDARDVGQNLRDHYNVWLTYRCKLPITINDHMATPFRRMRMGLHYLLQRKGMMAVGPSVAGAFLRTDSFASSPDAQAALIMFSADLATGALDRTSGFSVCTYALRPRSQGSLEITSSDGEKLPRIRFNYLHEEYDRKTTVRALQKMLSIMRRPELGAYIDEASPAVLQASADSDLLEYARAMGRSGQHASCTCRMGNDRNAVVDNRLRLQGAQGFRIADASIMPTLVSGNTNAAVIMIAEKAAEMILQDLASYPLQVKA